MLQLTLVSPQLSGKDDPGCSVHFLIPMPIIKPRLVKYLHILQRRRRNSCTESDFQICEENFAKKIIQLVFDLLKYLMEFVCGVNPITPSAQLRREPGFRCFCRCCSRWKRKISEKERHQVYIRNMNEHKHLIVFSFTPFWGLRILQTKVRRI